MSENKLNKKILLVCKIVAVIFAVIFISGTVTYVVGIANNDQFIKKYHFEEYSDTSELNDFVMCKAEVFVPLIKSKLTNFVNGQSTDVGGYGLIMTENGDFFVICSDILTLNKKGTINGYHFDYSQFDFSVNEAGVQECSTYVFGRIADKTYNYDLIQESMNRNTDDPEAAKECEALMNTLRENNILAINLYTRDFDETTNWIEETGSQLIKTGLIGCVVSLVIIAIIFFMEVKKKLNESEHHSEIFSGIADILNTDFGAFKNKCDFTDSTSLNYSFTYVIDAHMGGRDLVHVYFSPDQSRYYLKREITEAIHKNDYPYSDVVDERTKDTAGFASVSKQAITEMAIDRLEWIKACNYMQNSEYKAEADNCIEILNNVNDLNAYSDVISRAEQRYQGLKQIH